MSDEDSRYIQRHMQMEGFVHYVEQCDKNRRQFDMDTCARDIGLKSKKLGKGKPSMKNAWGFLIMCVSGSYDFESKKQVELVYNATLHIISEMKYKTSDFIDSSTIGDLVNGYKQRIHYYSLSETDKMKNNMATDLKYFIQDLESTNTYVYPDIVLQSFQSFKDNETKPYITKINKSLKNIIKKYPNFEQVYHNKISLTLALKELDDDNARIIEENMEQLKKYINKYTYT